MSNLSALDTPLDKPMREAFAQGWAAGLSPIEAAARAGYAHPGNNKRLREAGDIRLRAETILERRQGGFGADLSGIIQTLIAAGRTALTAETLDAKALTAALACLSEAAQLKGELPPPPRPLPRPATARHAPS